MKKRLPPELRSFPLLPRYGGASLVEVPNTILKHFGASSGQPTLPDELWKRQLAGSDKVVLFFVDGLGFDHVERMKGSTALFEFFSSCGTLSPITTIFPTTTAAGLTAAHSGLPPEEHGLPEWTLYLKELDMVIETIPFKPYKEKEADKLLRLGGSPSLLFDRETVYETLSAHAGIPSFVFGRSAYCDSAFSRAILRGAAIVPYTRGSDMMVRLRALLQKVQGPAYFFVYWDQVDACEHEFGPGTDEHRSETAVFSHLVMNELFAKLSPAVAKDVSVMLTADHGQIPVRLEQVLYIEDHMPEGDWLLKNGSGNVIMPTGSARDMFLFAEPAKAHELVKHLKASLSGKAEVMLTADAISNGLFGFGHPSKRFLNRVGNVLILPLRENLMWHREYRKDPTKLKGTHGGLSPEELLIPFGAARLGDIL